jgi:hypothetical protein
MIAVVQVEVVLASENARHLGRIALISEHILTDGSRSSAADGVAHIVIGSPNQVPGVALLDEFGHTVPAAESGISSEWASKATSTLPLCSRPVAWCSMKTPSGVTGLCC